MKNSAQDLPGLNKWRANMIKEIVSIQRKYFDTDATKSIYFRKAALKKLQSAVERDKDKILDALKKDLNKSGSEGYLTEVGIILSELRFAIKNIKKWSKTELVSTPLVHFHAKSFVVPEPYGVVLIVSPWNYPFQLCLEPLIGGRLPQAIALLSSLLQKHPIPGKLYLSLLLPAFSPEYVKVADEGEEYTELLDQKYDYIFFTGSAKVGKLVMGAIYKNLIPVSLELGGKNPCIVDRTAGLKILQQNALLLVIS